VEHEEPLEKHATGSMVYTKDQKRAKMVYAAAICMQTFWEKGELSLLSTECTELYR